jgi:hypothetical protein
MDDETREDRFREDSMLETSHPDIDSALEIHIGTGDFCYKTRTADGITEHILMRLKKGQWKEHLQIDDDEVKTFSNEELATFLIHQISMDRAIRRRLYSLIILFLGIIVPIVVYTILVLGIDDFGKFIIAGGLSVSLFPIFCFLMSSSERSVDDKIYASCQNFIDVLQKMIDLKDEPYLKAALEKRLQRLQNPYRMEAE